MKRIPSTRNRAHATGANNGKTCIQPAPTTGNHPSGKSMENVQPNPSTGKHATGTKQVENM